LLAHAAVPAPTGGNGTAGALVPGALEKLRQEYDQLRRRQPSPTRDLRVFRALTRYHLRRLEMKKAAAACEVALAAALQVYESIGAVADQARFQQCQADLLIEAGLVFKLVGRPDLAEKAQSLFPPPGTIQRRQRERRWQRNRRFLHRGFGMALVQLFLGLAGLLVLLQFLAAKQHLVSLRFDTAWLVASIMLTLGSAIAVVTALVLGVLGRFVPSLRHKGGAAVFFLAILPWLWLLGAVGIGLIDWLGPGW
jgi:hypothetical protein